jgi:cell division septal protein FtsQ
MRRKRKKKKIGRRVLILLLGIGLFSFCILRTHDWVKQAPFFTLKEIVIQGNTALTEGFLLEQSGITPGLNLFQIRGTKVKERLLQIPRVKWVEVRRRWPGTLHVMVREKEPIGRLNDSYEIGKNGELFPIENSGVATSARMGVKSIEIRDQTESAHLLSIVGSNSIGDEIQEDGVREGAMLIRALTDQGHIPVERIDVSDPRNVILYLTSNKKVLLGRGGYENKIEHLSLLLNEIETSGRSYRKLDLRFRNQAVIR